MSAAGGKNLFLKHKVVAGLLTLLVMLAAFGLSRCMADDDDYKSSLPVEKLVVETKSGKVAFEVEIAQQPMDLHVGLMFRKKMAKDHGMLFEFGPEPKTQTFWMKNTYIPLDMLFVADNGRIVNIHRNAHPEDTTPIPSIEPVTGVVEINGGLADELGIQVGDHVAHPYFK